MCEVRELLAARYTKATATIIFRTLPTIAAFGEWYYALRESDRDWAVDASLKDEARLTKQSRF